MFPRAWMTAIAGIGVLAGSFFATNAIIDLVSQPSAAPPADDPQTDGIEALKTALIYDERTLQNAAFAAKLRSSESLKGMIDAVQRMPDGRVVAAGWAVDTRGNGAPRDNPSLREGQAGGGRRGRRRAAGRDCGAPPSCAPCQEHKD